MEQANNKGIGTALEVTALKGEEAKATRALWEEAMPGCPQGFLDYYFADRVSDNVVLALKDEKLRAMLHLAPYTAAMRRDPPPAGAQRPTCMADVARVPAEVIAVAATDREYRRRGCMRRLMEHALDGQRQRRVPLCLVETQDGGLFEHFGFHYIYDRPQYRLDETIVSRAARMRAAAGEEVALPFPGAVLTAADDHSLLSLAHFVNASLCPQYGYFIIRSAAYYERFREEIKSCGGELYQIHEDGQLKGCFACIDDGVCQIREAVFKDAADMERYINVPDRGKPAVMARIVDLPGMLRHIPGSGKVTVAVRLTDPLIAENNGLFRWYIDKDGSHMERVEEAVDDGAAPSMRPEVTATIGEFTAFLLGYSRLKQNMKFDSIYLSGPAWINERC